MSGRIGDLTEKAADDELPAIDAELARTEFRLAFRSVALEAAYHRTRQAQSHLHNRVTVPLLALLFDIFWFADLRATPEVIVVSAWLRLGVLTPAAALFVWLDWRRKLHRWNSPFLVALAIAPSLLAGIICLSMTSPSGLPNLQAVPLLLLSVLIWRVSITQAAIISATSCLIYVITVLTVSFVPPSFVVSMLLTDAGIAVAAVCFVIRIDFRERQVFLFRLQADIRREILAEQNRILAKLTQVDALTGLGNRRCFDQALAAMWAEPASDAACPSVALVMFDIDNFKDFNDTFGHQAGDECLTALARAVSQCLRSPGDTLVRYGGEEFAVILPAANLEDGETVAERLREAVLARAIPHPGLGPAGCVTISLGVATILPSTGSAAMLIEMADRCLYAAKRNGRNCTATRDPPGPLPPTFAPPTFAPPTFTPPTFTPPQTARDREEPAAPDPTSIKAAV